MWRPGDPVARAVRAAPSTPPASGSFPITGRSSCSFTSMYWFRRYGFPPLPLENPDCAATLGVGERISGRARPACGGARICPIARIPRPARRCCACHGRRPRRSERRRPTTRPTRPASATSSSCSNAASSTSHTTRACYNAAQLRRLLPEERQLLLLDAKINARGVCANVPFLEAVRALCGARTQCRQRSAGRDDQRRHHLRRPGEADPGSGQQARPRHDVARQALRRRRPGAPTRRLRARAVGAAPARRLRQREEGQETAGVRGSRRPPHPWRIAHLRCRPRPVVQHRNAAAQSPAQRRGMPVQPSRRSHCRRPRRARPLRESAQRRGRTIARCALCQTGACALLCRLRRHRKPHTGVAGRRAMEARRLPAIRRDRRQAARALSRDRGTDAAQGRLRHRDRRERQLGKAAELACGIRRIGRRLAPHQSRPTRAPTPRSPPLSVNGATRTQPCASCGATLAQSRAHRHPHRAADPGSARPAARRSSPPSPTTRSP